MSYSLASNFIHRTIPDFDFVCKECFHTIDFAGSYNHFLKLVRMKADVKCPTCNGTGVNPIPSIEVGMYV